MIVNMIVLVRVEVNLLGKIKIQVKVGFIMIVNMIVLVRVKVNLSGKIKIKRMKEKVKAQSLPTKQNS